MPGVRALPDQAVKESRPPAERARGKPNKHGRRRGSGDSQAALGHATAEQRGGAPRREGTKTGPGTAENLSPDEGIGNTDKNGWTEVGRRERRGAGGPGTEKAGTRGPKTVRTPRNHAVTIGPPKEGQTYASLMGSVTAAENLEELGVEVCGARKARSGAILLEVKGGAEHADKLAGALQAKLGESARVGRPEKSRRVLLLDVPEWTTEDEVGVAIRAATKATSGSRRQ